MHLMALIAPTCMGAIWYALSVLSFILIVGTPPKSTLPRLDEEILKEGNCFVDVTYSCVDVSPKGYRAAVIICVDVYCLPSSFLVNYALPLRSKSILLQVLERAKDGDSLDELRTRTAEQFFAENSIATSSDRSRKKMKRSVDNSDSAFDKMF